MKLKTATLTGPALDWAVAKCEGRQYIYSVTTGGDYNGNTTHGHKRNYSADWSLAGPIIERERITVTFNGNDDAWEAYDSGSGMSDDYERSSTPLIAAMRCYVASKLGDEVEIPDELAEKP